MQARIVKIEIGEEIRMNYVTMNYVLQYCKNEICEVMQAEAGVRKKVQLALADLQEVAGTGRASMTPLGTGRSSMTLSFLSASLRAQLRETLLKVLENLHTPRQEEVSVSLCRPLVGLFWLQKSHFRGSSCAIVCSPQIQ
jgi:hypothetical protein